MPIPTAGLGAQSALGGAAAVVAPPVLAEEGSLEAPLSLSADDPMLASVLLEPSISHPLAPGSPTSARSNPPSSPISRKQPLLEPFFESSHLFWISRQLLAHPCFDDKL